MLSPYDRACLSVLLLAVLLLGARGWLHDHPRYDPWAPLALADPPGWVTDRKLSALRSDLPACHAFLARSTIERVALAPTGEGECRRLDRGVLALSASAGVTLSPRGAQATCAVDAALAWWIEQGIQPAAQAFLHGRVVRIEHLGTNNCRRIAGSRAGNWSEHAAGNAIDIAAFVLSDGRRVAVRRDWNGQGASAKFLHAARDGACDAFGTVLSPDYNAAHADHLHLDQARRPGGWRACR